MNGRRRLLAAAAATIASVLITGLGGVLPAEAATPTNGSKDFLVVLNGNIENRITCRYFDFDNLLSYLGSRPLAPDLFTVQQVKGQTDAQSVADALSDALRLPRGTYKALAAVVTPHELYPNETDPCVKAKSRQTNAIIYRTSRFDVVSSDVWLADTKPAGQSKCTNADDPVDSRSTNIKARLKDRLNGKYVNVGSFHWPTTNSGGAPCVDLNRIEAALALANLDRHRPTGQNEASLRILGGDANAVTTADNHWWTRMTAGSGDGYRDTQCRAEHCDEAFDTHYVTTTTNPKPQLASRIDFLFARSSHGVSYSDTISGDTAGGYYSEHRAELAHIIY
jgi:hypothetical protein